MKFKKIFILILILLMSISAVNAHGVDVTDNHMVIADDTNGANAKNLADANGINITVYKFTSSDEAQHILLHAVNNTDKRVVVIAYQDDARKMISQYPELKSRVFISSDDNEDLRNAMMLAAMGAETNTDSNNLNFAIPLIIGLIVGVLVGMGSGVYLSNKKLKK